MIPIWQAATVLVGILVLMGLVSTVLGLLATRQHFAKIISARISGARTQNQHSQTG